MKNKIIICCLIFACGLQACKESPERESKTSAQKEKFAIAIHGGAGAMKKSDLSPEDEVMYFDSLKAALTIGENILKNGGSSLDAVEQTIVFLENCPLFNAGKGAVFTHDGVNELDASIMEGKTQMAGAVSGVTIVKNPIKAARAVMEKTEHVLLSGKGAETFAKEQGLDIVPNSYFRTEEKWKRLQNTLEQERKELAKKTGAIQFIPKDASVFGTVGVVALDQSGNLAAGTSTGGMNNKRWNRIGDAPIIGAGTYADNNTAAVSCTGHGEYFIRFTVARDITALMEYKNMSLQDAANQIVMKKLVEKDGSGGIIAVDKMGNVTLPYNSDGMFRGYAKASGERKVAIHETWH